ncbi:aminopeptidase P family protein [Hellea sp.]|nr:aminopeptidase P family protein [Hellea sp.]
MRQDFDMIQNFEVQGGPEYGQKNLPKLRKSLEKQGLDGFLVPHEDEYQNEYLPDCNERLMWVSGFTGSAGAAVVMTDTAAMFVDGRYTLQVAAQVDNGLFSYETLERGGVAAWLRDNTKSGQIIGYDPRLHSPAALDTFKKSVTLSGATLKALDSNPIDAAWTDRPEAPKAALTIQSKKLAGESHSDKRARIGKALKAQNADAALITSPASIAWLLNIRGGDVMCTPLPLSTAIVKASGQVDLFVNPEKLTDDIRTHLGNDVSIRKEEDITESIEALKGQAVIADPAVSSAFYFEALKAAGASIIKAQDPVALPKACKNSAEIAGTTEAHKRDAVPLIKFLHWLDTEAQSGKVDEIDAAGQLEHFRHETGQLKDLSFESISGAGSNGAIVHYRVSKATTKKLAKGSLFLIDSGAQYQDGTTDVTRTVPIGKADAEMRERFTLVLKGHIALATVRFPEGTTGSNLDALARHALWQHGLDYDHGTGHGVGVYLGVHEGPQRISKMPNKVALKPGMIVSNEPGYYKTDGYGIRIENLQYVTEPAAIKGGERKMLGFANLTLAPLHKDLIDVELLTASERKYVDDYHTDVWGKIGGQVEGEVKAWLKKACAPL